LSLSGEWNLSRSDDLRHSPIPRARGESAVEIALDREAGAEPTTPLEQQSRSPVHPSGRREGERRDQLDRDRGRELIRELTIDSMKTYQGPAKREGARMS
jgi:hypothetical protein